MQQVRMGKEGEKNLGKVTERASQQGLELALQIILVGVLLLVQAVELQAQGKLLEGNLDSLQLGEGVAVVWRVRVTLEGGEEAHWMALLKEEAVQLAEN